VTTGNRRGRRHDRVDAVVVGVGAAGGVLLRELAHAGWRVVGLEAGPHWSSRRDFVSDELTMRKLAWRERRITAGTDPIALGGNVTGRGVGGSTVHYSMYALRMHRSDFTVHSTDGVAEDWPLRYEDLEPYYDRVERYLGIAGPRDWPWDPPRGRHPYPPHQLNGVGELMASGCDNLGITWRPAPVATLSAPKGRRPPCINRGFCLSGCTTDAKSSTLVTYVPDAIAAGAEIRADCMVSRIDLDSRGRACGVTYLREAGDGYVEEHQPADVVIVCGYAIETPRLLLMSATDDHRDGLANSSGRLGTGLMVHSADIVYGRFPDRVGQHKGPPASTISQDFYDTDTTNDYVRGYSIETVGPLPIEFARQAAGALNLRGPQIRAFMADYLHYAGLGLVGETLPRRDNTVTLHPHEHDRFDLPVPVVSFSWGENERRLRSAGIRRQSEILDAAGAETTFTVEDTAHLLGGAPMGVSPDTSVVDADCRAWDVPGLYICDGSVFVTSSAANPSLTIQALAARTADRLLTRARQQLPWHSGALTH
jgi:choline dehydrogenase-like flavoprotein